MHTLENLAGLDWKPEEALQMLRQLKIKVDSITAPLSDDVVDLLFDIGDDYSVFEKRLAAVQKQEAKEAAERKKAEEAEKKAEAAAKKKAEAEAKKAEAEAKKAEAAEKKKAAAEAKKAAAKSKAKAKTAAKAKPKTATKAKAKAKAKAEDVAESEEPVVTAEIIEDDDAEEAVEVQTPEVEMDASAESTVVETETVVEEVAVTEEAAPAEEAEEEAPKVIAEIIEESEEERLADLERREARVQSLEEEQSSGVLAQAEKRNKEEKRRQARREQKLAEPQGPTLSTIQADPEVLRAVLERDAERKRRAAEPPAPRVGRRAVAAAAESGPAQAPVVQAPLKGASPDSERERRKKVKKVDRSRLREDGIRRETAAAIREFRSGSGFGGPRKRRKRKREEPVITTPETVTGGTIEVESDITVEALAGLMNVPVNDIILSLMEDNLLLTKNQSLEMDMVRLVAGKFDFTVEVAIPEEEELFKEEEDDPADLVIRPPVVTVMGHVDHGKTSLLDTIRATKVVEGEAGGITQHIAAYDIEVLDNRVTFLDTPGHQAFAQMRARGAHVTDVVVLVVAANDGVKPQTIEAIHHAQAAEVPIVVAINKCDLEAAQPDRIRQELTQYNLLDESWGGTTIMKNISAKMNEGVDELMEMLVLQSEMLELKANPNKRARGTIVESELSTGLGPVAWVLVQDGTLRVGDCFLAGTAYGKVRTMIDCRGVEVEEAGPSTPVVVTGFSMPADAGEVFIVTPDERTARDIAEKRLDLERTKRGPAVRQMSLEDFHARVQGQEQKVLNMIIKGDVQGSVDVLQSMFSSDLGTPEVSIHIVHAGVGSVTESDVDLAVSSESIVVAFNVTANARVKKLAEQSGVDIRSYRVIYDAQNEVRAALEGMLTPESKEVITGHAEVRDVFASSALGKIAGCYQTDGETTRGSQVRLIRDGVIKYEGRIASLRRHKDDVKQVATGFECGIKLEHYEDIQEGDIIESFKIEKIAKTLDTDAL